MKLLILHLSDLHIENSAESHEINIDRIASALNIVDKADKCVVVVSGDLSGKGNYKEYNAVSGFIGAVIKKLVNTKFMGEYIDCVFVPGNHDLDFTCIYREENKVVEVLDDEAMKKLIDADIVGMKGFFNYACRKGCFKDDKVVSKKEIKVGSKKVNFVMVNSAPLSLLGGKALDMGSHYLSKEHLDRIEAAADAEINILVMHHSIEWFFSSCKERLRKIISHKYSLLLTGHEHEAVGESRNINGKGDIQCIQGNALRGYVSEGNGFCTAIIDIDNNSITGKSFVLKKDIYVPSDILNGQIKRNYCRAVCLSEDFENELKLDGDRRNIEEFYVSPGLWYETFNEENEIERYDIETEEQLFQLIEDNKRFFFYGQHKSGKSTLAKRLYKRFLENGKVPLLLTATDMSKKRMDRVVSQAFEEQYLEDNYAYHKFQQMSQEHRVVILDEVEKIDPLTLDKLLLLFENQFGKVIIFSEERKELNIGKRIVDNFIKEKNIELHIKPFLYSKRKILIEKILKKNGYDQKSIDEKVNKINELINVQVKFFDLTPEFIINFVDQYEKEYRFNFSPDMNVFSKVYENSIMNKIIINSSRINVNIVYNLLREIAYYMHFKEKSYISLDEIGRVVEEYCDTYRQKVNIRDFLDSVIKGRIIIERVNEYRFNDHTLLAYFVAQAISQKYSTEEGVQDKLLYLLKNLCFGVNADILLFLAFITHNPSFLKVIVTGASKHFCGQEELCFDMENIKFILDTDIEVKDSLPSKEEKKKRDEVLSKQEEHEQNFEVIELVDEYNHNEEDLKTTENQMLISLKYIEILSKALPAFCQDLKAEQQDDLVKLLYKCPNQLLYFMMKEIDDRFDEIVQGFYEQVAEQRKDNKVSTEEISDLLKQLHVALIVWLYQLVARTCTTEQSISALRVFDYRKNTNYEFQHLIMLVKYGDVESFARLAMEMKGKVNKKLEKKLLKLIVRTYFLWNDVEVLGVAQSLMDLFFEPKVRKKLKMDMARNKLIDRNRT